MMYLSKVHPSLSASSLLIAPLIPIRNMITFTFILLLLISAVFGAPDGPLCGNNPSGDEISSAEAEFSNEMTTLGVDDEAIFGLTATIPVYFHVIRTGPNLSQGNVPDDRIKQQIKVLNQNFGNTRIKFVLKSIDRTTNADWFDIADFGSADQTAMKKKLRKGGKNALNVYTVGSAAGRLGYATFPWQWAANSWNDGVVLLYTTLPGGSNANYHDGKMLTHEVGHWVGLYHTFEGGCSGSGDYVSDTPAGLEPSISQYVCSPRDTCPTKAGNDPIHNYMEYTYDPCRTHFTKGQITRFKFLLLIYRGIFAFP